MTREQRRTADAHRARLLSAICALAFAPAAAPAVRDIPDFDVATSCRQVASRAEPLGNVDACLREEREAREQLAKQWPSFAAADKSHCIGLSSLGGEPTYSELLTCLELARDARNAARDGAGGTSGQGR